MYIGLVPVIRTFTHFYEQHLCYHRTRFKHEASINITLSLNLRSMPPKSYKPSDFGCCRGKKCLLGCRLRTRKTKDGQECKILEHAGNCPRSVGRGGKRTGSGRATSIDNAVSDQPAANPGDPFIGQIAIFLFLLKTDFFINE